MNALELKGQKFGRLTVASSVNAGNGLKWLTVCDCGGEKITRGADLKSGKVKSCGCLRVELPKLRTQHGLSNSRFYKNWIAMRQRCNNPNASRFAYYGGRGIKVCERWEVFENFLSDMHESYLIHVAQFGEKNTSLDRKDNDGSYSPENCKWATQKEQVNNSRKVLNKQKGVTKNEQQTIYS